MHRARTPCAAWVWKNESRFRSMLLAFISNAKYLAVPLSPISGGNSAVTIALPCGGLASMGVASGRSLPLPTRSPKARKTVWAVAVSFASSNRDAG